MDEKKWFPKEKKYKKIQGIIILKNKKKDKKNGESIMDT